MISNFNDTYPKKLYRVLKVSLKKDFYTLKHINYCTFFILILIKGLFPLLKV